MFEYLDAYFTDAEKENTAALATRLYDLLFSDAYAAEETQHIREVMLRPLKLDSMGKSNEFDHLDFVYQYAGVGIMSGHKSTRIKLIEKIFGMPVDQTNFGEFKDFSLKNEPLISCLLDNMLFFRVAYKYIDLETIPENAPENAGIYFTDSWMNGFGERSVMVHDVVVQNLKEAHELLRAKRAELEDATPQQIFHAVLNSVVEFKIAKDLEHKSKGTKTFNA